ncbi:MAG: hypothetical protein Q8M40_10335 [Legionella sp.]|nr:hypothetical protein [Legionella sp.]
MESIDNFVSKETFKNQKEVEEHLKYIHQIAPDITLSKEFQDLFRKTTGKSIEQYKDDHKNKKAFNSFQKYQQDTGKHSTPNFFPLTQAQQNEPIVPNDSYSPK